MARLIDADAVLEEIRDYIDEYSLLDENGYHNGKWCAMKEVEDMLESTPTVDAVPVVRCQECKHRPIKSEKYDDGFDLAFPNEFCPCYCDDDPFYSWYPSDDWFCPKGERKGEEHENN